MPPESLAEMQRLLAGAFGQFEPLAERADLHEAIGAVVSGNDRLSPIEQAEIYREQYWLRHRDCLYEDYPGLSHLLGDEPFEAFLRAYLSAFPPSSYTLRDLGNRLAEFAAGYPGFDPAVAGAARDMARYELAFVRLFDGPDAAPASVDRLVGLPPEAWAGARIVFHPCIEILALEHPVHELRAAVRAGKTPPRTLARRPVWLALWRGRNLKVAFKPIDELEAALLERLREGERLASACDAVAARVPPDKRERFAPRLGGWFRAWAERGWVVDVLTGSS